MTTDRPPHSVDLDDLTALHPLDDALALMYYGWRGMTREADAYLATLGLSRVHHRILYTIARRDGLTVSDLLAVLRITKQALHRPMKHLQDGGLITTSRDPAHHRYKRLHLTVMGQSVEDQASGHERRRMEQAFADAGPAARDAWAAVMASLGRYA
ncbi:helix-turn-helix domain-containing protein [Tistrella bauzanensis]|jgi:DNA-binding MarR family transcriptional regulator|uniref:Helix-turn-helix domain-containing protein n=1 Tax=Tistrella arctica TaxID=3133430 RepID=A0ABU9YNL9_9PROT